MNITPYFSGKIANKIENPINGTSRIKIAMAVADIEISFSIATQKIVNGIIILINAKTLLLEIKNEPIKWLIKMTKIEKATNILING